jgi:hypothetical protein
MPRGSPDFTDRTELQYMHFTDIIDYSPLIAMPAAGTWYTIVDTDMEGVFGRIRVGSTDPYLYLRIKIDDAYTFDMHAANLLTIGCYGINSGFNKYGVTRYDAISNHYDFFYDEHFGLWIKSHLTVQLSYEVAHAGDGSWHLFYKKKEA